MFTGRFFKIKYIYLTNQAKETVPISVQDKKNIYIAYPLSILLITTLGAYVMGDGDPEWKASFSRYFPAHITWFLYDFLKSKLLQDEGAYKFFSKEGVKRSILFIFIAIPSGLLTMTFVVF